MNNTMTPQQIALARQLFPNKRPSGKRFAKFYSPQQLQWLRDNYPHNSTELLADIMNEKTSVLHNYAYRQHLRQTSERKRDIMLQRFGDFKKHQLFLIRYGLPHDNRKHYTLTPYDNRQRNARQTAHEHGYILGNFRDETTRWFIYYDENTRRSPSFERHCRSRYHFWVQPLPSWRR